MTRETQPDAESDAALLARFASVRDEAAFAELMRRHGPLVLSVTTRMLRQRQDAEDALQAVFLTLAARARALRRVRSVAGWLHNVAVRVSLNVLKMNRRRERGLRRLEQDHRQPPDSQPYELTELLDEELAGLPARLKEIVILRDLEGFSRSEVAKKLRLPPGTVDSRLSRGRKLLRDRLVRRGVTVGASGLAAAVAHGATAAQALPVALVYETFRHAEIFLSAGSRVVVGMPAIAKVTTLAKGELNTMFLSKLSTTVGIAALVTALVLGAAPISEMAGLSLSARAAQIFLDDFEDGSATDGNPINWIVPSWVPNGMSQVQNGSLVLTPSDIPPALPSYNDFFTEMDVTAEGVNVQDLSLRTQVRGLSPASADAPYWIGFSARDTLSRDYSKGSAVIAGVRSTGEVALAYTLVNEVNGPDVGEEFARIQTNLDFVAEDVNMQLDVVGNQVQFTAWSVSQQKPQSPLITGTLPNALVNAGTVVLWAFPQTSDWNKPAAYRYVELVGIPEPSSVTLGSLGGVALASFAFRRRLGRVGIVRV